MGKLKIFGLILTLSLGLVSNSYAQKKEINQQTKTISGKVVDDSGAGLIGVTVVLKDQPGVGTVTDTNGTYTINAPETSVLVFSYVGYATAEMDASTVNNKTIVLKEEIRSLDDVVIVAYGSQKKASVVGAIVTTKGSELIKSPVSNVGVALEGRLVGLTTVQRSGQPGGDTPELRIRGQSNPLVIVDGIERSSGGRSGDNYGGVSGWEFINPNDIETVSMLKDASATAVYGVKGANGVIIITTKKGLTGKPEVNFSAGYSVSTPMRLRTPVQSYDYLRYLNEGSYNDGDVAYKGYDILMRFKNQVNPLLYPDFNSKEFTLNNTAPKQNYDISIRGGNEFVKYFVSGGYTREDGLIKNRPEYKVHPNFTYDRYSMRSNLDFQFTKRFSAGINMDTRFETRGGPNGYTNNIFFTYLYNTYPWETSGFNKDEHVVVTDALGSVIPIPYMLIVGGIYKMSQTTSNNSVNLKHDLDFILPGLSAQAKYAFDSYTSVFYNMQKNSELYSAIDFTDVDGKTYLLKVNGDDGALAMSNTAVKDKRRKDYFEASLNYTGTIGADHALTGLALYNMEKRYYADGVPTDVPRAYLGFVGRTTYAFKDKYLAEFNIGINGSENFPVGKRYGIFPAMSVGWVVTNEKFYKKNDLMNYMKIRGSLGQVGNDISSDRFLYMTGLYMNYPASYKTYFGEPGQGYTVTPIQEGKASNPNVTWEVATKSNIGIDANFIKQQLSLTADIFQEKRDNILTNLANIPTYLYPTNNTGFSTSNYATKSNYNKLESKGIEVELGWNSRLGKTFSYFIRGTVASYSTIYTRISELEQPYPWMIAQGTEWNTRGLISEGFWNSFAEIANPNNPFNSYYPNPIPGDIKYKDINGDMRIDDYDLVPLGYTNTPRTTYTGSLGFSFHGFDCSVLLQGASDVVFIPAAENQVMMNPNRSAFSWIANRWTPTNRELATYPVLHNQTYTKFDASDFKPSTFWAYDATYLRLKNLEIAYNLPKSLLKNFNLQNVRLSLSGQNLFTWTKTPQMDNFDPELGQTVFYPLMSTYSLGCSVTF